MIISTQEVEGGEKIGDLYFKGDFFREGDCIIFFKGYLLDGSLDSLLNSYENGNLKTDAHTINGEFILIIFDKQKNSLFVINDLLGREPLYTYQDGDEILLGNDFWEICKALEVDQSHIDYQVMKESIVFMMGLDNRTFIKKVNFLPPHTIIEFNLNTSCLKQEKYWNFRYTPQERSTHEQIEELSKAIEKTMRLIHENHPGGSFGLGLSGGIDSRLVALYAKEAKMNVKPFIIGEQRPKHILLSRDHKNAELISAHFGYRCQPVRYDNLDWKEKLDLDIRYNPSGFSQLFKIAKTPDFDVLLTGASDMLVGSRAPKDIDGYGKDDLLAEFLKSFSLYSKKRSLQSIIESSNTKRIEAGLIMPSKMLGIITQEELDIATEKLKKFISHSKTNFELFQEYLIFGLGSKNKLGMFESLLSKKISYTIYYPFAFKTALRWDEKQFMNRELIKKLLLKKCRRLAEIPTQDWKRPYAMKKSIINFVQYATEFKLRGAGVMRYDVWARSKKFVGFVRSTLEKEVTDFDRKISLKEVFENFLSDRLDVKALEQTIKLRKITQILGTKDYKQFCTMQKTTFTRLEGSDVKFKW